MDPAELIAALDLRPLPGEGGYYRETYRSGDSLPASAFGGRYGTNKSASTAMYYLVTAEEFSALHRLPTDEVFHFYAGDVVELLQLYPDGSGRVEVLGPDVLAGQQPQLLVPGGVWQGCAVKPGGAWALLGTTVAPAFDFADYEAGGRAFLVQRYPAFADRIRQLTRGADAELP